MTLACILCQHGFSLQVFVYRVLILAHCSTVLPLLIMKLGVTIMLAVDHCLYFQHKDVQNCVVEDRDIILVPM
jgi:hypothetical protein